MVPIILKINNKIIEYIVYFLLILTISNTAQVCFNQTFKLSVAALFMGLMFLLRKKIGLTIILTFAYWVAICVIYSLYSGEVYVCNKVIGYALPVFVAYFAMKIIGPMFWCKLEKWIYVLTIISVILFIGNLAVPGVYESLSSVFGRFIATFYTDARPSSWYAFVYTYSPIEGLDYWRNSGFMWEPGAFAMTSITAFVYRVCKNNMQLDVHSLVYVIAVITTVSSAGIIALLIFFIYYFINKKNLWGTMFLVVMFFTIVPYIYEMEFMSEKLASYMDSANANSSFYNERLDMQEYNRFSVFEINMKRLLEWPLGYGVYSIKDFYNKEFVGVNGIATFARMWGVCGLALLLYGIYKTTKLFTRNASSIASYVFLTIFLVMFFSNPIEGSALTWFFCFTPFIYKHNNSI